MTGGSSMGAVKRLVLGGDTPGGGLHTGRKKYFGITLERK